MWKMQNGMSGWARKADANNLLLQSTDDLQIPYKSICVRHENQRKHFLCV